LGLGGLGLATAPGYPTLSTKNAINCIFRCQVPLISRPLNLEYVLIEGVRMTKISRNAPCPCGSGKKYKKCCLLRQEAEALEKRKIFDQNIAKAIVGIDDLDDLSNVSF